MRSLIAWAWSDTPRWIRNSPTISARFSRWSTQRRDRVRFLGLCGWCAPAAAVETLLFLSYRSHDARFHWFTHFFVGASAGLIAMAGVAARRQRAISLPLLWIVAAHLFAMFPDLLFLAGIPHQPWMDLFLAHISSHFVPGQNLTSLLVFLAALATYLVTLVRIDANQRSAV